jgi:hypothetical protein
MYENFVKQNAKIVNNIAVVDNRGYTGNLIHAFFVSKNFPNIDVIIMIKTAGEDIRFTMFFNNFKPNGVRYDLLSLAKQMNPNASGGHKSACGFTLRKDMDVNTAINLIANSLLGNKG